MSRLVNRIKGDGRAHGVTDTFMDPEQTHDGLASGIRLGDGSVMQLDGQPPVAVTKGWGNLSFLRFGHR